MARASFGTSIVGALARFGARVIPVAAAALTVCASPTARAQDCQWPTWTQVGSNPELARFEHAMAYDAARDEVIMFGGRASAGVLGDTLRWNGKSWQELPIAGPAPRASHAMAYDPVRERVILTGGKDALGAAMTDTWEWDGARWVQAAAAGPVCQGPVMVFDQVAGRTMLANHLGELWTWDGAEWLLLETAGPPVRAAAFDPARNVLVVTELSRTHEWHSGTGWQQVSAFVHPFGSLTGHTMFYNAVKGGVMIFGGNDLGGFGINFRGGAFVLRGGAWWTWGWHGMVGLAEYDRQDHATVVLGDGTALTFGGRTTQILGDTRVLTFERRAGEPMPIFQQPEPLLVLPGATASFSVTLMDTALFIGSVRSLGTGTRWYRDGEPLANGPGAGGTIVGADTRELAIVGARLPDAGVYNCLVSECGPKNPSEPATLAIQCPANLTTTAIPTQPGYGVPDDRLSSDDFFYYLSAFAAGNLGVADLTTTGATAPGHPGWLVPDGVLNSDDFFAYLTLYAAGC